VLLAGCATPRGAYDATEVPAPRWRAGDVWVYRRTDLYTKLPTGIVTRDVAADAPGVRLVTRDAAGRILREAEYESPGIMVSGTLSEDGPVTGTLRPPLEVYAFPLVAGKRWRQTLTRTDASDLRHYMTAAVDIEGWENVRVADRDYRALVIRRRFRLGPKDSFNRTVYRTELEWYAPEVRGAARLRVYEDLAPWGRGTSTGSRFVCELQSFRLT